MDPLRTFYWVGFVGLPYMVAVFFFTAVLIFVAVCSILLFVVVISWAIFRLRHDRTTTVIGTRQLTVGFFHPYCDAGGGGERVLWTGIRVLKRRFPDIKVIVYTGDVESAPDQILRRAKERFHIDGLEDTGVEFVYLHSRRWVEAETYPRFTLFGQTLGSLYLGWEALNKRCPDVYLDTMGYAFTLPLFKYYAGCHIGCYVHYPTLSTDMLEQVRSRKLSYNNVARISQSGFLSAAKLIYYKIFAQLYGLAGSCSDLIMVNSSWTEDHISQLWSFRHSPIHKIYPPCDVAEFRQIERRKQHRVTRLVSIGQFRPEKDQALQIKSMFELRQLLSEDDWEKVKLVLIGGCRNEEDRQRVEDLKDLCRHLSVEDNVEFKINIPFSDLKEEMGNADVGLHSMWNEHFGIAVVEMMAAGLLTIAHRSGGPMMDIVVEEKSARNGFLAAHEKEYAAVMAHVITGMSLEARNCIRERARDSVNRFSEHQFEIGWLRAIEALFNAASSAHFS